jgi:hypothetical protein
MAVSSGRLCALQNLEILHKLKNISNLQEFATSRQSGVIFVNISTIRLVSIKGRPRLCRPGTAKRAEFSAPRMVLVPILPVEV